MMKMLHEYRPWVMWAAALLVSGWYLLTDPYGGADTVVRLQYLAWITVLTGPVYLIRRALMDGARGRCAYDRAMRDPVGAGLVFLGLCLLTGLLFLALTVRSAGAQCPDLHEMVARAGLPDRATEHITTLSAEIRDHWPGVPMSSALGAQVEQETCYSLRHSKCWSPRAELKTSREYGFGLGQLTVTSRFDNFAAARGLHQSLRDWQWEDRYDPGRQLRTMVLMDRAAYGKLQAVDEYERLAMAMSAYNGGLGGVLNDRRLCAAVDGCDPGRWFGHVAEHSTKARAPAHGYGKSFFEINREYVRNVLIVRRPRYVPLMEVPT